MTLESLRMLARHWPTIFGKAQGYEVILGAAPIDGRSDAVDARTPEIRAAIDACNALQKLYTTHPDHARVMLAVYVLWGEKFRTSKDSWVELWRELHPDVRHKRSATARNNHCLACMKLHEEALQLWRTHV